MLLIKKLIPALLLIAAISAILLISDTANRNSKGQQLRLAMLKFASNQTLDYTIDGYIEGLAVNGYKQGDKISINHYNAEGDIGMANVIAREIVNNKYDLVMTASTPALQIMANANKNGTIQHVFGAVTDPWGAGVGVLRDPPGAHPDHLVGYGTFQPVAEAITLAKSINPGLKRLGTIWCIAEANSEACVRKARETCKELDIELVENTVDNASGVMEAANVLIGKGVDAVWIGGDNAVDTAIDVLLGICKKVDVPCFSNYPVHVTKGTIFSIGANYYTLGTSVGKLASELLGGKPSREIEVVNMVPQMLYINQARMHDFPDWPLPDSIKAIADSIVTD